MADQTDTGKEDPREVSAGKGDIQSGGGGAGLPPLSLVFECLSFILLKLGRGLVDCVALCTTLFLPLISLSLALPSSFPLSHSLLTFLDTFS